MKTVIPARELVDANITKVSLVKHGANRTPFKIVKAEAPEGSKVTLGDRVADLFKKEDGPAKITAVMISKTTSPEALKVLREQGFTVTKDNAEVVGDVVILKQDGYDADSLGTMVALTSDVAVGFDRIVKGFESWTRGNTFSENLQACSFYPSYYMATEALTETVWQIMYDAHTPEEAGALIDTALKEFSKYVKSLLSALPQTLFKTENLLKAEFEASKKTLPAAAAAEIAKSDNKGEPVKKTALNEAAPGDLDGLLDPVVKDEAAIAAEAAAAAEAEAAAAAATDTSEADAAAAAAAAAAGGGEEEVKDPAAAAAAAAAVDPSTAALQKMADAMATIAKGQAALLESVNALDARVAKVEGTAQAAVAKADAAKETADNTVVAGVDFRGLDESLTTLNGDRNKVAKQDAPRGGNGKGLWDGLLPGLSGRAAIDFEH